MCVCLHGWVCVCVWKGRGVMEWRCLTFSILRRHEISETLPHSIPEKPGVYHFLAPLLWRFRRSRSLPLRRLVLFRPGRIGSSVVKVGVLLERDKFWLRKAKETHSWMDRGTWLLTQPFTVCSARSSAIHTVLTSDMRLPNPWALGCFTFSRKVLGLNPPMSTVYL